MKRYRNCTTCGATTSMNVCPVCRTTKAGKPAAPKPPDPDQLAFDLTTGGMNR